MNWNSSGDNDNKDPWGNSSKQQGPPDLDKVIKTLITKIKLALGFKKKPFIVGGSGSSSGGSAVFAIGLLLVILFVIWLIAGFFIVAPAEQAVVLRFGKYSTTLDSGPHWVPRLVDSYYKVNVQRVSSFDIEEDLLTKSSGEFEKPKQVIKVDDVSANVTQDDDTDKNVVYVEMSVQYRIADPHLFLFNVVDGVTTLKQVAQSALTEVVGTMQLNDVLTRGRDQLGSAVSMRTSELMKQYKTGVELVVVNIRKAQAPEEVADAFLDVVQAGQDEQRYIQQAQAYASKVVPIAEGVRNRILADAGAYREKVVLTSEANVASYNAILGVYKMSPVVTKERMYIDTMQSVLTRSTKMLIDTPDSQSLMYLPLDKLLDQAKVSKSLAAKAASDSVSSIETVSYQAGNK
jgi:membrane protease subunit HflK